MIIIIGFIAIVIIVFRYIYYHSTIQSCREKTEDGITYRDCFGHTRLLDNDRRVGYRKVNGKVMLCFENGIPVDQQKYMEDISKFKGEYDCYYMTKKGIRLYKILNTGEIYAKHYFNHHLYYIEYNEDKPMRIVLEGNDPESDSNNTYRKINIEEMNIVFESMFRKKEYITSNYFDEAWYYYRALKCLGTGIFNNVEPTWQTIITRENIDTLVPDPNEKRWY